MADKITNDTVVSSTELAVVLGLTQRRVQQLAQDGTIQSVSRGKFSLADSVQRYISFLDNPNYNEEDEKIERVKRISESQFKAAKATIAKLEAEELKGNMHRAEDVEKVTETLVYTIRSALMAFPSRLAVDVIGLQTASEASEVIRKEVNKVMSELANYHYDPKKYEELVRQRRDWTEREEEKEDE